MDNNKIKKYALTPNNTKNKFKKAFFSPKLESKDRNIYEPKNAKKHNTLKISDLYFKDINNLKFDFFEKKDKEIKKEINGVNYFCANHSTKKSKFKIFLNDKFIGFCSKCTIQKVSQGYSYKEIDNLNKKILNKLDLTYINNNNINLLNNLNNYYNKKLIDNFNKIDMIYKNFHIKIKSYFNNIKIQLNNENKIIKEKIWGFNKKLIEINNEVKTSKNLKINKVNWYSKQINSSINKIKFPSFDIEINKENLNFLDSMININKDCIDIKNFKTK